MYMYAYGSKCLLRKNPTFSGRNHCLQFSKKTIYHNHYQWMKNDKSCCSLSGNYLLGRGITWIHQSLAWHIQVRNVQFRQDQPWSTANLECTAKRSFSRLLYSFISDMKMQEKYLVTHQTTLHQGFSVYIYILYNSCCDWVPMFAA
jgi:hypothetical protein